MGKMGSNPFFFTRLLESLAAGGGSPDGPMDGPSAVKTDVTLQCLAPVVRVVPGDY